MIAVDQRELDFIEGMGLIMENSGGSKTLGRVFGYLMLADRPRTLDEISRDLLFSKATASLTIRQGLTVRFFEKVGIPGERKDFYRVNTKSWIESMSEKLNAIVEWEKLIDRGLRLLAPENTPARENLEGMKDYFEFVRWYMSDIYLEYQRWRKGEIDRNS